MAAQSPLPFIHLRAAKFPVLPDEDTELVNEGTYGKALALHIEEHLKVRSYSVAFVCCEDWGWWVEVAGFPFATGVCVYATADLPRSQELCVAVTPDPGRRWSWRRLRMIDTTPFVTKLFDDLTEIFSEDPDVIVLGLPSDFPLAAPHQENQ